VIAGANDTYVFDLASGRGGIAFVIDGHLSIYFGMVAELNAIPGSQCEAPAAGDTITGTIAKSPRPSRPPWRSGQAPRSCSVRWAPRAGRSIMYMQDSY
jgi:hypothetical protein